MKCCENCGWLSVNPGGAMFCGYSEERTWKDECCMAWKDKDEPLTNADRIRSASDEELADFITTDDMCELLCGAPLVCEGQCKQKMLDWLKQEVSNG